MSEIREKLEGLEKELEGLNAAPAGVVGKDDAQADSFDSVSALVAQRELREKFVSMDSNDVKKMLDVQAGKQSGRQASDDVLNRLAVANPNIAKVLDASGGAALIRQDLEPMLYALFVKRFPFFDRIRKEGANGLVHAYNQQTAYGDAAFMTEAGTVTDDTNTYARQTTNVAVLATRRGITLKSQFAITQGGAGFDGLATELSGGVTAIAHKLQKTLFQGNASSSTGTAGVELGAYDANPEQRWQPIGDHSFAYGCCCLPERADEPYPLPRWRRGRDGWSWFRVSRDPSWCTSAPRRSWRLDRLVHRF